ncbi:MAG: hypothetical protein AAFQ82_24660 [Myxococcota bacterium]
MYPFNPERRQQLEDALSNYRWAGELLGDAALTRSHGVDDALSWFRQIRDSGSELAPWAIPSVFGAFYLHGVMRRSQQVPRLIGSAVDAWMEGNRELVRTVLGKNDVHEQPTSPESV